MGYDFRAVPGLIRGSSALTQFRAVVLNTAADRTVDPVTNANGERPIGILQDDPAATGDPCLVAYDGVCEAEYGGSVTAGDTLAVNNSGQLISDAEVTDGSAVDLHHIATALEAGASGERHMVLLHTPVRIGLE